MNQRSFVELTRDQKFFSQENKIFFAKEGIDYGLLSITQTGLDKSIMDAIGSLRIYFKINNFHDYNAQNKGVNSKITKKCHIITGDGGNIETTISLYRPETKNGDPRVWVYNLKKVAISGDEIAFIIQENELYVFNISKILLHDNAIVNSIIKNAELISLELLNKLIILSKNGPLKSIMPGDTGIGMTIENALGIPPNSSPTPDYKGIELKSSRSREWSNRNTLFAQVANWNISKLKSSADIVDKYGYERDNDLKLYVTVTSIKPNPQGLYFNVDFDSDRLNELHINDGDVATWLGDTLRTKLLEKHKETFWIKASSSVYNGEEYFKLNSVIHTKNPLHTQFFTLVEKGIITMDHLIKRKDKTGSAKEKGPLFKINPNYLNLLFPEPKKYALI